MSKTLYLVSSVPTQRDGSSPAEDLYTSHWFTTAKAYVATFAQSGDSWVILSAKHGLLDPAQVVKPYDESKIARSRQKRQLWNKGVVNELLARTEPGDTIVMLAGQRQREPLVGPLSEAERIVEIPMAELRISQQKAWMRKKLEEVGVTQSDDEQNDGPDVSRHGDPSMLHSSALISEVNRIGGGSPKPGKVVKS